MKLFKIFTEDSKKYRSMKKYIINLVKSNKLPSYLLKDLHNVALYLSCEADNPSLYMSNKRVGGLYSKSREQFSGQDYLEETNQTNIETKNIYN